MATKLNLIAAACENMGIGKNGDLPWKLKSELAHFTKMTTQTKNANKQNAVIMGRKTWDHIPKKFRPFKNRLNIVLTRNTNFKIQDENVLKFNNLETAVEFLKEPPYSDQIERIWIIGGSEIYKLALDSKYSCRIYLTRIHKEFDCDAFFPKIPEAYKIVSDPDVPTETQEENKIKWNYYVYDKNEN